MTGLPTPPPVCEDKIPNCKAYNQDTCTNPDYRLWVMDNCKKYCGLCKLIVKLIIISTKIIRPHMPLLKCYGNSPPSQLTQINLSIIVQQKRSDEYYMDAIFKSKNTIVQQHYTCCVFHHPSYLVHKILSCTQNAHTLWYLLVSVDCRTCIKRTCSLTRRNILEKYSKHTFKR